MQLQFVGSGDAFGSGGRFNTCMRLIRSSDTGDMLIDCGASSMVALRQHGVDPNRISTIVISHLHGDHFGGLPFFILDAQLYSRRVTPLVLIGPPGFARRLTDAMEIFFAGSSTARRKFDLIIHELTAGAPLPVEGGTVTGLEVEHACGAPPLGLRITVDGKTIAYSGDTEWTDTLIDLSRDADLFVVEALFFDKRIPQHLDYATFRNHADRCSAKRVILTHFGPDMLARLSKAEHEVAADGKIFEL